MGAATVGVKAGVWTCRVNRRWIWRGEHTAILQAESADQEAVAYAKRGPARGRSSVTAMAGTGLPVCPVRLARPWTARGEGWHNKCVSKSPCVDSSNTRYAGCPDGSSEPC